MLQENSVPNGKQILRRVDIFANIAIWSAAIGWGFCFFIIFIDMAIRGVMLLNSVALLSGIISLLRIKCKKSELKGIGRAFIGLSLGLAFWLVIAPAVIKARQGAEAVRAMHRLHQVGPTISAYVIKYGNYPVSDKWCDLLVSESPNVREFLGSSKHNKKEDTNYCIYAINPDCEPNSHGDMVLLFETNSGWNQYGGFELMNFDNHSIRGACVLFKDYHVEFVSPDEVSELRWK